ncbi:MAG: dihydrodipicolinate synthase family protein [Bacteroidota bacterium]|nr:dihydrodipicolinate synthase family protein [Chitinophagaceae bacterium]MCE2757818.1 dihydrodipicolinate synthase family protein [Chitinophagaceae bacterium]GDX44153.1 dihydrodipicolinate synthase family protein [Bacteroidota bacterium]
MAIQFKWEGVFPALLTPFTAEDQVDYQMFEKNLDAQIAAGVAGVIIGGSLGEASTLLLDEKKMLVEFALKKLNGKVPVILNIAEGSTKDAVQQARLAESWGADGIMLLPPMRYKADDRETVVFFKSVAKQTALPIMIYNNPVDYKINVTLEMFKELSECKNINAIKESTREVMNVTRLKNRFGNRFAILCGVDPLTVEELALGADGLVAGLVDAFPKETVVLYNLVKAGKMEEAIKIYRWFMPLLELDIHPKLVQYIKLAATEMGIGSEYVRAPRLPLVGEERETILKIIRDGIATKPSLS